jgi:hypothetical protein
LTTGFSIKSKKKKEKGEDRYAIVFDHNHHFYQFVSFPQENNPMLPIPKEDPIKIDRGEISTRSQNIKKN